MGTFKVTTERIQQVVWLVDALSEADAAERYGEGEIVDECYGEFRIGSVDETEANARLMAFAPDLLAALQQLMDWEGPDPEAGSYSHVCLTEDTEQRANEVWGDAKAAIAKATGREVEA